MWRLPLLLALLSWSSSFRITASAFARQSGGILRNNQHLCEAGVHPTCNYSQRSIMPSSLRARGGGASKRKLSAADDGEKIQKVASGAIQSIRYCCKMCFFSVFADLLTTLIDGNLWAKFSGPGAALGWADFLDLFDSTSLLIFGGGLWRIAQLYWSSLGADEGMGDDKLLDLFGTMRSIWGILFVNLGVTAVSMAVRLPTHRSNDVLGRLWDSASSQQLAAAAVAVVGIWSVVVQRGCEATAKAEASAYRKKRGIMDQRGDPNFSVVRDAGFYAYRNQASCAGVFGFMAALRLVRWVISYDGKIVGHVFKVTEVLTPLAICTLLFTLNHNLLKAAIATIVGNGRGGDEDGEIYNDLFVAQSGFYTKVGDTLKGATIALLLPYVAAPLLPPVLRALSGISFFAKAFERFGIQV